MVVTDASKQPIGRIFDELLVMLDPSKRIDRQFHNVGNIPEKQKPQPPPS
jgi:ABC-type antimicrobial peptide transport system ATPase subunit